MTSFGSQHDAGYIRKILIQPNLGRNFYIIASQNSRILFFGRRKEVLYENSHESKIKVIVLFTDNGLTETINCKFFSPIYILLSPVKVELKPNSRLGEKKSFSTTNKYKKLSLNNKIRQRSAEVEIFIIFRYEINVYTTKYKLG